MNRLGSLCSPEDAITHQGIGGLTADISSLLSLLRRGSAFFHGRPHHYNLDVSIIDVARGNVPNGCEPPRTMGPNPEDVAGLDRVPVGIEAEDSATGKDEQPLSGRRAFDRGCGRS